jgi:TonB family protein
MKQLLFFATLLVCFSNLIAQQTPRPKSLEDEGSNAPARGTKIIRTETSQSTTGNNISNKPISGGVLNGKATSLPKPAYPAAAMAVRAGGAVSVQILIDEEGNVVTATATSGHPLLRAASEKAALGAKFSPTTLSGIRVRVTGVLVYNFVSKVDWLSIGKRLSSNETSNFDSASRELPPSFAPEKQRIQKMAEDQSTSDIDGVISLIETKLNNKQLDLWEFQIGTTIGKILGEPKNSNSIRTNLLKIRQLVDFPPTSVTSERIEQIRELSNFSNSSRLSKKDILTIIELCETID